VSKECTVTRPTTGAVGVDAVVEEEDDEGDENKDVFSKAHNNTVSSTTPHPPVRAKTSSTRPSPTDSAYTTLSMVNVRHSETGTSVMNMTFNGDRVVTPPATPRVLI
jgi:hypothetical protein